MNRQPARLYHYTCEHGREKILKDDSIRPASTLAEKLTYPMLPKDVQELARATSHLCWFTDLQRPLADVYTLGLLMLSLTCDRMAFCFEVECDWRVVSWWPAVRRTHKALWLLEEQPGVLPAHWFVSEHPVTVLSEV